MIEKSLFGKTQAGIEISLFTITNASGASVCITNYGGIIQSLHVPDKYGVIGNVVLGFDTLDEYLHDRQYTGATVGRYANRIANGQFSIDGISYKLNQNDGRNHLHGGVKGFNKIAWDAAVISENTIQLTYISPDGEEGYPGNLKTTITYALTDANELRVNFKATTDKATIVNVLNHSYFNLTGKNENILNHTLQINAKEYLLIDSEMVPAGEIASVEYSPFNFLKECLLGKRIHDKHIQLQHGNGYDHCWVLDHPSSGINKVATLAESTSGRCMEIYTDKPGLHVYTGNYLRGKFSTHGGVCLETEYFPNAPNQPNFPPVTLRPEERYDSTTVFKFSIR